MTQQQWHKPEVGQTVRVLEVYSDDTNPSHTVGQTLVVAGIEHEYQDGFYWVRSRSRVKNGVIARFELAQEPERFVIEGHGAEITGLFADEVRAVAGEIADMLIEKNRAYGDSALNPVRIFSQASNEEQLRVRIDDKLSRLARGSAAGEDVIKDLLGYLVMLRIQQKRAAGAK